ncbi:MAG: hypothetical protein LUE92_05370 [Clostridiales bacterium]|nr:hypothetical protein [Clostridiales bacterium]
MPQTQLRKTENLNGVGWKFKKDCEKILKRFPARWESVSLPHTWNALDGQDGGKIIFAANVSMLSGYRGRRRRGACGWKLKLPLSRRRFTLTGRRLRSTRAAIPRFAPT